MRKLQEVSYDIADLNAPIAMMQNYITSLQLEVARNKRSNDWTLFIASLVHEKGLSNLYDNLELISKNINQLADEVLDQHDYIEDIVSPTSKE